AAGQRQGGAGGVGSGAESDQADGGGRGAARPLDFPRVARFNDTVTPPDFQGGLANGRFYEEEVPKAKVRSKYGEGAWGFGSLDESEDEDDGIDPSKRKKKRRWRRHDPRPKRWVVQENIEFLERLRRKRQRSNGGDSADHEDSNRISSQYHGVVEANSSSYIVLSVDSSSAPAPNNGGGDSEAVQASEDISVQPVYGFHSFSQPNKVTGLSMEEAERAIEQQRNAVTRYMMHGKLANADDADAAAAELGGRGRIRKPMGPKPKAMSRARLLGKLAGGGDEDDDVMGDVRFSSSKGGSAARRELLTSLADDGMRIDDDGVLGGANDSEFGGRRRFARVAAESTNGSAGKKNGGAGKGGTSTGFEAGAMAEDFYHRDVAAEYEALDYDASEQFDNDDVNVGEDEMAEDAGGYGGDYSSGDDMIDGSDVDSEDEDGLKGMASASGLRKMLAKARGESPVTTSKTMSLDGTVDSSTASTSADTSGIDRMSDTAKRTAAEVEKNKGSTNKKLPSPAEQSNKSKGIMKLDKDGRRVLTIEAVRREIWLNNGEIKSKPLMKKFDVNKANPERQEEFKRIVRELCSLRQDADGNKLVLKPHYAKG
ncbi:hypothetical protein THAOC_04390, partial [Thalassiosira oceanica]